MNIVNLRAWEFILSKRLIWLITPILYLMLAMKIFSHAFIPNFLLLICSIGLYGFYAITLNDFFDKAYDIRAGKHTGIEKISNRGVGFLLLASVVTCLLVAGFLAGICAFIYLFGLTCTTLYSHPKTRLKEKGIWGPVSNSLAELTPLLFILAFFNYFNVDALTFIALYGVVFLTSIINHQLTEDYHSDKRLQLKSFAANIGYKKTVKFLRISSTSSVLLFFLLSTFFLLEIKYFYMIFSALISFYLLHPLINPEIKKAFKVPVYFIDFIHIGLFGVFPLYFAFLLLLNYPVYFPIFLLTVLCNYRFILVALNRTKVILK